jgi:hypothetical protein
METEKSVKGLFKTKMVGDSLYLLVDKKTREYLAVNENEYLMARISTIKEKHVQCPKCNHECIILSNDNIYDCPLCGYEFEITPEVIIDNQKQPVDNKDSVESNDDETGSVKGGEKQ